MRRVALALLLLVAGGCTREIVLGTRSIDGSDLNDLSDTGDASPCDGICGDLAKVSLPVDLAQPPPDLGPDLAEPPLDLGPDLAQPPPDL